LNDLQSYFNLLLSQPGIDKNINFINFFELHRLTNIPSGNKLERRNTIPSLVEILEEIPPIGAPSWVAIQARFAAWATEHGRPLRDSNALRAKYVKLIHGKPTGVGGLSDRQKRFRAVEDQTHRAVGGNVLADSFAAEDDSDDLAANAVEDAIEELDGIETTRSNARGLQTLKRLSAAVKPSKADDESSASSAPKKSPRQQADVLSMMYIQQQQATQRWEQFMKLRAEERKEELERREFERKEAALQRQHEQDASDARLVQILAAFSKH